MKKIDTDNAIAPMTEGTAHGLREKTAKIMRAINERLATVSAIALFAVFLWKLKYSVSMAQSATIKAAMSDSEIGAVIIEALLFENSKAYALGALTAFVVIIAAVAVDRLRADMEVGE